MLGFLGDQSFELVSPVYVTNRHGNREATFPDNAPAVEVKGCSIQPGPSSEDTNGRDEVTIRWTIYAPPGTAITADQAARFGGVLYQIDGQPGDWTNDPVLGYQLLSLVDWQG